MDSTKNILIEREYLFKQVWDKPIIHLAKEYGLSDVGLVKICKKLNVPRPPQGYWTRKHRGGPPKLHPTKGPTSHEIVIDTSVPPSAADYLDPQTSNLIQFERTTKNKIKVKKTLCNPHPLVLETKVQLSKAHPNQYSRLCSWREGGLAIAVCKESVPRALLILNTLVKTFEKRGFSVSSVGGKAAVTVLNEQIFFTIDEKTKRYEPKISPEYKTKNPHHYAPRYAYKATGRLNLSIRRSCYAANSWHDNQKRQIEDCLNDVIVAIYILAESIKKSRIDQKNQEDERKKKQAIREAEARQLEQEKARRQQLLTDAENWQKAQLIRDYITAVEKKSNPCRSKDELTGWILWATNYANRLDPTKKLHRKT